MNKLHEHSTVRNTLNRFNDDPDFLSSFARGLVVIEAFSAVETPQTIADIAKLTGFPRATVRRILYTLLQLEYVSLRERHYRLTPKVLMLSDAYLASNNLANLAQPLLESISKKINEASSLALLNRQEIIYVARSSESERRIMANTLRIGSRLPAYCTSMGRVLLAALTTDAQIKILQESELKPYTPYTIYDPQKIIEILKQVKAQGYAEIEQELETGLYSIAVPIFDKNAQVIAALNISTHVLRTPPDEARAQFLPLLLDSARMLKDFF